jgi:hydrogenase maturation protease
MPGVLIIGYGNPLRGDDGLGWQVANEIARNADESIEVVATHQLTPELAEPISAVDLVIFVDASSGGQPGSWQCEPITEDPVGSQAFTHYFTPASLLGYANAIFNAKPAALLISAAAGSFDCAEALTPHVAALVPEIVRFISATVKDAQVCVSG